MKRLLIMLTASCVGLLGCRPTHEPEREVQYEYKAMSLAEMFEGNAVARAKIGELMVNVSGSFNRTDMDVADYTEALNRLGAQGWQLVAVNKSNYWIFRKAK